MTTTFTLCVLLAGAASQTAGTEGVDTDGAGPPAADTETAGTTAPAAVPSSRDASEADAAQGGMSSTPPPVAAPEQGRQRLLILNLEAAGVDPNAVKVINGLVTQGLSSSTSLEVITSADLGALVNLEAERAATGCDTTSCLAEIAGAMGTRYVVFGTVGRLGDVTLVQLSLYDSEAARPVGRQEVRAQDEAELLDSVPDAARTLVSTIVASDDPILAANATPAPEPVEDDDGMSFGVIPIALFATGGGVALVSVLVGFIGTTFFVVASSALTDTTGNVPSELKNNLFKPFGPFGAIAGGFAMAGFGVGAAVATAGFFVE